MKSTLTLFVVPSAILVVLFCLFRNRRAPQRLLKSEVLRRALRLAAVVLVLLGFGREVEAQGEGELAKPSAQEDEARQELTPGRVEGWCHLHEDVRWRGARQDLLDLFLRRKVTAPERVHTIQVALGRIAPKMASLLRTELEWETEKKRGERVTLDNLNAALLELNERGHFDPALDAVVDHISRRVSLPLDEEPYRRFVALMARRAVISDALILALREAEPLHISPRAWMSKAGPGREVQRARDLARRSLLVSATEKLRTMNLRGPALTSVTLVGDSWRVQQGDEPVTSVPSGTVVEIGRFTILEAMKDAQVEHAWLGTISFPTGLLIPYRGWSEWLNDDQRREINETIDQALAGDMVARGLLELSLPLVHVQILKRLAALPEDEPSPLLETLRQRMDGLIAEPIPELRIEKDASGPFRDAPRDEKRD